MILSVGLRITPNFYRTLVAYPLKAAIMILTGVVPVVWVSFLIDVYKRQIPTIVAELKLSQSTVRRALHDLRKAGLIEIEQRYRTKGGKSSLLYKLRRE